MQTLFKFSKERIYCITSSIGGIVYRMSGSKSKIYTIEAINISIGWLHSIDSISLCNMKRTTTIYRFTFSPIGKSIYACRERHLARPTELSCLPLKRSRMPTAQWLTQQGLHSWLRKQGRQTSKETEGSRYTLYTFYCILPPYLTIGTLLSEMPNKIFWQRLCRY